MSTPSSLCSPSSILATAGAMPGYLIPGVPVFRGGDDQGGDHTASVSGAWTQQASVSGAWVVG